jgi:hypothetical protein
MKPNKPIAAAGLAAFFFLAGVVGPSTAQPETKLENAARMERLRELPASQFTKVIVDSVSPNKRLAVAVGAKDGTQPAWQKLSHEGESSFILDGPVDDAANYLIKVQDDRVVAILDGNYFGTFNNYNHASYVVIWSPDSRWLVEQQDWKWHSWPCTAHRINADGIPAGRIGLKPMAEKCVDEQLRKLSPKLSAEEREGYAIKMKVSEITNDGEFTAEISAEIPKSIEEKYVTLELSIAAKIEESVTGALSILLKKVSIPITNKPTQNER